MSKTKYVYLTGKAQYARLREDNRDMGANLPEGSDQRNKIEAEDCHYIMNLLVTPEAKKQAIADGVPNRGMMAQLWKEDAEGNPYYKCKRVHKNNKLKDRETGEFGVIFGPPKVLIVNAEGKNEPFNDDIGNDSVTTVKLSVYDDKIVTMEAVRVDELIEWVRDEDDNRF